MTREEARNQAVAEFSERHNQEIEHRADELMSGHLSTLRETLALRRAEIDAMQAEIDALEVSNSTEESGEENTEPQG